MMAVDPTKSKLAIEQKHGTPLLICAFDPGGRFLFAGGRDRDLAVINLASNSKSILAGHESWVIAMSRASRGLVLTADQGGRVVAWDCTAGEPKQQWQVEASSNGIHSFAVSADGEKFAVTHRTGGVTVRQTADGKLQHELPRSEHPAYEVAWHPDGKSILAAYRRPQKPQIKVWDIDSSKERMTIDVTELSGYRRVEDFEWGGIRGLAISPDAKEIVACGRSGYDGPASALCFDGATGKQSRRLTSTLKGFYHSVMFHPQGFLMSVGGDIGKGEFRTWGPQQVDSLTSTATAGPCTSLDIHPDGKRFAITLTTGKGSYPDSGILMVYDWLT